MENLVKNSINIYVPTQDADQCCCFLTSNNGKTLNVIYQVVESEIGSSELRLNNAFDILFEEMLEKGLFVALTTIDN